MQCRSFFGHDEPLVLGLYQIGWRADSSLDYSRTQWSRKILELKYGSNEAVEFFFKRVHAILPRRVVLSVVPSHRAGEVSWGMRSLVSRLAKFERIDGSSCLERVETIEKLAYGGWRAPVVHEQSIVVRDLEKIRGRAVILLDDVVTTGASIGVCRELLLKAGAVGVRCVVLGRAVRE